jgi:hypothetical protein
MVQEIQPNSSQGTPPPEAHIKPPEETTQATGTGNETFTQAAERLAGDAWGSFKNTLAGQGTGAIQLSNHVFGTNFSELQMTKVDDPNSGWGAWGANLVGQAGAMATEFFAMRKLGAMAGAAKYLFKGTSTAEEMLGASRGLSTFTTRLGNIQETTATKFGSSVTFGALMGGVLTPTNDPEHFWRDRAINTASSIGTMATMTGLGIGMESWGSRLTQNAAANVGTRVLGATLQNGYFNQMAGGYAGGVVGDVTTSKLHGQDIDWTQANRSGIEFGLIGMGTHTLNLGGSALHSLTEQRAGTNTTNARHLTDTIGLTRAESPNQAEFFVVGGRGQLARMGEQMNPANGGIARAQGELQVQPKLNTVLSGFFGDGFTKYGTAQTLLLSHGPIDAAAAARADIIANCMPFADKALQAKDVFRGRSVGPQDQQPVWWTADSQSQRLIVNRGTDRVRLPEGFLEPMRLGNVDPKNPQHALYLDKNGEVQTAHVIRGSLSEPPLWLGEIQPNGQLADLIDQFAHPDSDSPQRVLAVTPEGAPADRLPQATWNGPEGKMQVFFAGNAAEINGVQYIWIESPSLPLGRKGVPADSVSIQREPTQVDHNSLKELLGLSADLNNIQAIMPVYETLAKTPGLDSTVKQMFLDNLRDPDKRATIEAIEGFYNIDAPGSSYDRYLTPNQRAYFEERVRGYIESESGIKTPDVAARQLQKLVGNDADLRQALRHYARLLQSDPHYAGTAEMRQAMDAHLQNPRYVVKPLPLVYAEIVDHTFNLIRESQSNLPESMREKPTNAAALVAAFGGTARTLHFTPDELKGPTTDAPSGERTADADTAGQADAANQRRGTGAGARGEGIMGPDFPEADEPKATVPLSQEAQLGLAKMRSDDPAISQEGTLTLARLMNEPGVAEAFPEWRAKATDLFSTLGTEDMAALPDKTLRTFLLNNLSGVSPDQIMPVIRDRIATVHSLVQAFDKGPKEQAPGAPDEAATNAADTQKIIERMVELSKDEPSMLKPLIYKLTGKFGGELKKEIVRRLSESDGTKADINAEYLDKYLGVAKNRNIKDIPGAVAKLQELSSENPDRFTAVVTEPFDTRGGNKFQKPKPGELEAQQKNKKLNTAYGQLIGTLALRAQTLEELANIGMLAKARSPKLKAAVAELVPNTPKGNAAWLAVEQRVDALLDNNPDLLTVSIGDTAKAVNDLPARPPRPETPEQITAREAREAKEREAAEIKRQAEETAAKALARQAELQRITTEEAGRRKTEAEATAPNMQPAEITRLMDLDKKLGIDLGDSGAAQVAESLRANPLDHSKYDSFLSAEGVHFDRSLEGNQIVSFADEDAAKQFAKAVADQLQIPVKSVGAGQDAATGAWSPLIDVQLPDQRALGTISLDASHNVVGLSRFAGEHGQRLRDARQGEIDAAEQLRQKTEADEQRNADAKKKAAALAVQAQANIETLGLDGFTKLMKRDADLGTVLSDDTAAAMNKTFQETPLDKEKYESLVSRDDVVLEPMADGHSYASFPSTQSAKRVADLVQAYLTNALHPYDIDVKKVPDTTDTSLKRRIVVVDMTLKDPITEEAGEHVIATLAFDADKNIVGLSRFAGNNAETIKADLEAKAKANAPAEQPDKVAAETEGEGVPPASAADDVLPTDKAVDEPKVSPPERVVEDTHDQTAEVAAEKHEFATVITPDTKISEIAPIEQGGIALSERAQIPTLVEAPLVKAVEALYDRNIETTMSSANFKDIQQGRVYIDVDYDSLSKHNQAIAETLGQVSNGPGGRRQVKLSVPVTEESTVRDVQEAMDKLADQFQKQPLEFGTLDVGELLRSFGENADTMLPTDIEQRAQEMGMVYDVNRKLLFQSAELQQKYNESHPDVPTGETQQTVPPANIPTAEERSVVAHPDESSLAARTDEVVVGERQEEITTPVERTLPAEELSRLDQEARLAGAPIKYTGDLFDTSEFTKELVSLGDKQAGLKLASLKDEDEAGLLSLYVGERMQAEVGGNLPTDQPSTVKLADGTFAPVVTLEMPSGQTVRLTPSFDADGHLAGLTTFSGTELPPIEKAAAATETAPPVPLQEPVLARTEPSFADGVANKDLLKELSKKTVTPTEEERAIYGENVEKHQFKQGEHTVRSYWLPVDGELQLVGRTIDGKPTTLSGEPFADIVGLTRDAAFKRELYPTRDADGKVTDLPKGLLTEFDGPKVEENSRPTNSDEEFFPGEGKGAVVYRQTLRDAANNNQPYEISKVVYPGGLKLTVDATHSIINGEFPGGARFAAEVAAQGDLLVSNQVRYTGLGVDVTPPQDARIIFNPKTTTVTFEVPPSEANPDGFKMVRTANGAIELSGKRAKAAVTSAEEDSASALAPAGTGESDPAKSQQPTNAAPVEDVADGQDPPPAAGTGPGPNDPAAAQALTQGQTSATSTQLLEATVGEGTQPHQPDHVKGEGNGTTATADPVEERKGPVDGEVIDEHQTPVVDQVAEEHQAPVDDQVVEEPQPPVGDQVVEEPQPPVGDQVVEEHQAPVGDQVVEERQEAAEPIDSEPMSWAEQLQQVSEALEMSGEWALNTVTLRMLNSDQSAVTFRGMPHLEPQSYADSSITARKFAAFKATETTAEAQEEASQSAYAAADAVQAIIEAVMPSDVVTVVSEVYPITFEGEAQKTYVPGVRLKWHNGAEDETRAVIDIEAESGNLLGISSLLGRPQELAGDAKSEATAKYVDLDRRLTAKAAFVPDPKPEYDNQEQYHELLGVASNASDAAIRKAYERLTQSDDPDTAAVLDQAKEAFDVLTDSQKRAAYNNHFGYALEQEMGGALEGIRWTFKEVNSNFDKFDKPIDISENEKLMADLRLQRFSNPEVDDRGMATFASAESANDFVNTVADKLRSVMDEKYAKVMSGVFEVALEGRETVHLPWVHVELQMKLPDAKVQDAVQSVVAVDRDGVVLGLSPLSGDMSKVVNDPQRDIAIHKLKQQLRAAQDRNIADVDGAADDQVAQPAVNQERAKKNATAPREKVRYRSRPPLRMDFDKAEQDLARVRTASGQALKPETIQTLSMIARQDGNLDLRRFERKLTSKIGDRLRERLDELAEKERNNPTSIPAADLSADWVQMELKLPDDFRFMDRFVPGVAAHLLSVYKYQGRELFNVMTPPYLTPEVGKQLEAELQKQTKGRPQDSRRRELPAEVQLRNIYRDVMGILSLYTETPEPLERISTLLKPAGPGAESKNHTNLIDLRTALLENVPKVHDIVSSLIDERDPNFDYVNDRLTALMAVSPVGVSGNPQPRLEPGEDPEVARQRRAEQEAALLRIGAVEKSDEDEPGSGSGPRRRHGNGNRGRKGSRNGGRYNRDNDY